MIKKTFIVTFAISMAMQPLHSMEKVMKSYLTIHRSVDPWIYTVSKENSLNPIQTKIKEYKEKKTSKKTFFIREEITNTHSRNTADLKSKPIIFPTQGQGESIENNNNVDEDFNESATLYLEAYKAVFEKQSLFQSNISLLSPTPDEERKNVFYVYHEDFKTFIPILKKMKKMTDEHLDPLLQKTDTSSSHKSMVQKFEKYTDKLNIIKKLGDTLNKTQNVQVTNFINNYLAFYSQPVTIYNSLTSEEQLKIIYLTTYHDYLKRIYSNDSEKQTTILLEEQHKVHRAAVNSFSQFAPILVYMIQQVQSTFIPLLKQGGEEINNNKKTSCFKRCTEALLLIENTAKNRNTTNDSVVDGFIDNYLCCFNISPQSSEKKINLTLPTKQSNVNSNASKKKTNNNITKISTKNKRKGPPTTGSGKKKTNNKK